MAPRRNNTGHQNGNHSIDVHNMLGLDGSPAVPSDPLNGMNGTGITLDANHNHHDGGTLLSTIDTTETYIKCCVPNGDCFHTDHQSGGLINIKDLSDCVRVTCNNENCTAGQYMHRECFESWEQDILAYLKSNGRARSWSERQRQQNLWTKKGYDLVFKACTCKCSRGHIKKDLDWMPPPPPIIKPLFGCSANNGCRVDEEVAKKKKKRHRNNQKPTLALTSPNNGGYHPNSQQNTNGITNGVTAVNGVNHNNLTNGLLNGGTVDVRGRTGSLSSNESSTTSPMSADSSDHSLSPIYDGVSMHNRKVKNRIEVYSDRVRTTSGCNGIFSRRLDFSTFNVLPKVRLNSYQIKMEDEGNHGNDETRLFILSSLAQHQKSSVNCILCEEQMLVFDRYPLVDGTFFLSPKQHANGCIEVKYEGRAQFLTAVCMSCLEGISAHRVIRCRFCAQKWEGSSLVLGTMYAYDIFAAMPCCTERIKCNNCFKLLLPSHQRLNFFSDYSHVVSCQYCTVQDTHFVKPLGYCYTKQVVQPFSQWP